MTDYSRWRNENAHRNALNSHCYWNARGNGASPNEASAKFLKMPAAEKNEYLF
ncbi:hypothetical protein [Gynuella sp.]|uniref:hypothetical protein n=1 Tax=Gynuella sp. TaxID=2969146 RepID=UPI003D0C00FF